jgi:hypothetical protein
MKPLFALLHSRRLFSSRRSPRSARVPIASCSKASSLLASNEVQPSGDLPRRHRPNVCWGVVNFEGLSRSGMNAAAVGFLPKTGQLRLTSLGSANHRILSDVELYGTGAPSDRDRLGPTSNRSRTVMPSMSWRIFYIVIEDCFFEAYNHLGGGRSPHKGRSWSP